MKTNKSILKRLKVSKNGVVSGRKSGFNHFNAKQSRSVQLAGRNEVEVTLSNKAKNNLKNPIKRSSKLS